MPNQTFVVQLSSTSVGKVLLVDDDQEMLRELVSTFQDAGFLVTQAEDGLEAAAKIAEEAFDAVVTDIIMPGMNGLQLAANIKTSALNSQVPIFIISGLVGKKELARAAELQVVTVLSKPFSTPKLLESVLTSLRQKSALSAIDPQFVSCFTNALDEVVKFYLGASPELDKLSFANGPMICGYATGVVALSGPEQSGFVACSFGQALLKRISDSIFSAADISDSEVLDMDVIGEVVNQVAGRAKASLAKLGIHVALGLPQAIAGVGHKIAHKSTGRILRFNFSLEQSRGVMEFCLVRKTVL